MNKYLMYASAVALLALPAAADVWDVQTFSDDRFSNTRNQLLHGTRQTHDLAGQRVGPAADVDWYRMPQKPFASYEIIVDGVSADLGSGWALTRYRQVGSDIVPKQESQAAVNGAAASSRALRWQSEPGAIDNEFIRVANAECDTTCGSDDVYSIRARETTINVPRFNNSGGQTTVLLVQNASEKPVTFILYFWEAAGGPLPIEQRSILIGAKNVLVINLAQNRNLLGKSGSITIAHDASYGTLVVKAVALEPATGFTFDTPGVYVPD